MPAGFDKCKKDGGRIRTVKGPDKKFGLAKGEYMHVCFLGSQMFRGYKKRNDLSKELDK